MAFKIIIRYNPFLTMRGGLPLIPEQLLHRDYVMNMIQRLPNLKQSLFSQEKKDYKLPPFEEVSIVQMKRINAKLSGSYILAKAKGAKPNLLIDIRSKRGNISEKECEGLSKVKDALEKETKKKTSGWLICFTLGDDITRKMLKKSGIMITEIENLKTLSHQLH